MKNYKQAGSVVGVTAAADINSGDPVLVGGIFGVAQADAATGEVVQVARFGVYELSKVSTDVFTQGLAVYFDTGTGNVTLTSAGNTFIGYALEAAGNPSSTGIILLAP